MKEYIDDRKIYRCDICGLEVWGLIELDHVARCDKCHEAWLKICRQPMADCVTCNERCGKETL